MYTYKSKCLEEMIVCPFSKIVVDTTLWPMISLATGSWPDIEYQAKVPLCGIGLKTNHKMFGYPIVFMPLLHE